MHARAPRARVKISTRTFGKPMILQALSQQEYIMTNNNHYTYLTLQM